VYHPFADPAIPAAVRSFRQDRAHRVLSDGRMFDRLDGASGRPGWLAPPAVSSTSPSNGGCDRASLRGRGLDAAWSGAVRCGRRDVSMPVSVSRRARSRGLCTAEAILAFWRVLPLLSRRFDDEVGQVQHFVDSHRYSAFRTYGHPESSDAYRSGPANTSIATSGSR
jgi:hypothetical protein